MDETDARGNSLEDVGPLLFKRLLGQEAKAAFLHLLLEEDALPRKFRIHEVMLRAEMDNRLKIYSMKPRLDRDTSSMRWVAEFKGPPATIKVKGFMVAYKDDTIDAWDFPEPAVHVLRQGDELAVSVSVKF